jgi:hypothetical protein
MRQRLRQEIGPKLRIPCQIRDGAEPSPSLKSRNLSMDTRLTSSAEPGEYFSGSKMWLMITVEICAGAAVYFLSGSIVRGTRRAALSLYDLWFCQRSFEKIKAFVRLFTIQYNRNRPVQKLHASPGEVSCLNNRVSELL